ncbi:MAG: DUF1571 domain-containing protein [Planctomycetota bacterium]|nr:DUF1571 domain-containing protein [Planctomycetota bacterium]
MYYQSEVSVSQGTVDPIQATSFIHDPTTYPVLWFRVWRTRQTKENFFMSASTKSLAIILTLCLFVPAHATDNDPEIRVARKIVKTVGKYTETGPHPLDAAIEIAHRGLKRISTIKDYKAQMIRRERIDGELTGYQYCDVKIRNAQEENKTPFSIYMKFTKPSAVSGREAIWIKGQNQEKIIAHEAGLILGKVTLYLNPTGPIAMRGNRYPIYEAGFKVLVNRLIEKASQEKKYGECEVKIESGRKFNKRSCTVIEVIHPVQRDYFEFHKALIYIDDELQVPVRYEAYTWPDEEGGKPVLLEQYLWTKIELNVGLTDDDFNPRSKQYNYCFTDPPVTQKEEASSTETKGE